MTSKESMEFYALVGPDVARHIAEGGRIMGPVVEVSLGYKDGKPGFVIKGPSKEWKDAGEKINQILDVELGRLPPRTKTGLADIIRFISYFVPDEPLSLFQIEVWFSVPDGGTVGQCTRDSNRAIARHCETVRYSPTGDPGEYAPYQAWLLHRPEKVT